MVLDYHDKRSTQKVSERKPVQKNRPRRQSYGGYIAAGVAALAVTFGAGFLTGRLTATPPKVAAPVAVAHPAPKKEDAAAAQAKAPAAEPSLTFYQTLPAGSKGAIGSGINLNPPEPHAAAPKTPAPAAQPEQAQTAPAAEGRYAVQVASYRDKAEAEAAQAKLSERGLAAYVAEAHSAENGVWYRLRIGKHLTKGDAEGLLSKAGKGAVVLPE